jgi:MSHA biogenesis protein MshG
MPVFEYSAVDASGNAVKGTVFGLSLNAVADDLSKRGFTVEQLTVASGVGDPVPREFEVTASPLEGEAGKRSEPGGGSSSESAVAEVRHEDPLLQRRPAIMTEVVGPLNPVSLSAILFFFRQLSTMLSAGVNMVQSLDTLSKQTSDPRLRTAIKEFREHTLAGRPISAGMQRYPEIFTPVMLGLVRVGEEMGTLDKSLKLLAGYVEQEIELRNLYRRLTLYPKLVIASSIIIIIVANLIIGVIGRGQTLTSPLTTPETWIILAPLIIFLFLFFRIGVRRPEVRHTYDEVLAKLPYIGKTLTQIAMAKFGRAFGALYAGGVPITKSVQLAADASGNEYLRAKMYPAARDIENGVGVTEAFAKTGAFTPIVLDMTATGESTGNLDTMLGKLAEYYEDEAKTRSTQTAYIFFIVVYLAVAIYVGYVVISFWSGYYGGMPQVE